MKEKAWFVFRPRIVADLSPKNPGGKWLEYRIVKTICLTGIDYENFATDLLADRQFIEDHFTLCVEPGDCLLITGKRREPDLHAGGVNVVFAGYSFGHNCYLLFGAACSYGISVAGQKGFVECEKEESYQSDTIPPGRKKARRDSVVLPRRAIAVSA